MPASTPPSTPVSDAPPELTTEREHLTASRAALARMRARTSSLDSSAAGDWVSQQILESAIYRRMKALADDPTVPLFFGRLDYTDAHEDARGERFYIGRRHVSDEFGDPMVVDWRARISTAFYRASRADPLGVELRRRFGFQHGELTAYEDEALLEGEQDTHS
ncbi:MAG: AAA family ATPase, partial [Nocardioidaceae bacterium]